jgi:hypothetical protein
VNLLQNIIGDVNPRELFDTMVKFMHQTVEHQKKIEASQEEILRRLKALEDDRLSDADYNRSHAGS